MESIKSYITYKKLGGEYVPLEKFFDEIKKLPLDGVLGYLAILSLDYIQNFESFFNIITHGRLLNYAISDDFPEPLPNISNIYVPGHVPLINGSNIFIQPQNIALLTHYVLLYADKNRITNNIEYKLKCRILRLLLILNDYVEEVDMQTIKKIPSTLDERRTFLASWIRRWQFSILQNHWKTKLILARQYIIINDFLKKHFIDVESEFIKATKGIPLERYYQILALFIVHIYQKMNSNNFWLRKSTFCKEIKAKKEEIEYILSSWIQTPAGYYKRTKEWKYTRLNKFDLHTFDFIPLRATPLIEARPDELVCPAMNLLLEKIVDGPFFILSDYMKDPGPFHTNLGYAYEDYANEFIENIAKNDIKGSWNIYYPEMKKGSELSDIYLQRGDIGICFEHKGSRIPTDFLLGTNIDRVLGPNDEIIKKLDKGEIVDPKEILDNEMDEGLITKAMWQQTMHAEELRLWIKKNIGVIPKKIFPIITHYADIRIDWVCRFAYLEQLINKAKLYKHSYLKPPQWLHISTLETLSSLANENILDLESILNKKSELQNINKRFDDFLYSEVKDKKLLLNKNLIEKSRDIFKDTGHTFWFKKFGNND